MSFRLTSSLFAALVIVAANLDCGTGADPTASVPGAGNGTTGTPSSTTGIIHAGGVGGSANTGSAGNAGSMGGAAGSGTSTGGSGNATSDAMADTSPTPTDASSDAPVVSRDAGSEAGAFDRAAVVALIKKVAENQLAENPPATALNDWINAAFYVGLSAAARATQDPTLRSAVQTWSQAHNWDLNMRVPADLTNADDQICTQTYSELYLEAPVPANAFMYQKIRTVVDGMIAAPKAGRVVWWWCDALFMAPGAFVRLAAASGQTKYFDFMNQLYWDSKAFLFDPTRNLFYRDSTYFATNIFWSRGNGWVIAGIARILDYLPANDPRRADYVQLFNTLAGAIVPLQGSDGLWRADLLNAARFPAGEASGSGFFTFALAWGIQHGILSRDVYLPIVRKGWNGLVTLVAPDGRMQWVQPTGKEPAHTLQTDHLPFGAGAFLLAATAVLDL